MDSIIIFLKMAMGIPLVRLGLLAWCVFFAFICLLSISISTVPSRKLYKAGSDGAKKGRHMQQKIRIKISHKS